MADAQIETPDASPVVPAVDVAMVAKPGASVPGSSPPKRTWVPAQQWPALPDTQPRAPTAPAPVEASDSAVTDTAVSGEHGYIFSDVREDNAGQLNEFGVAMHATGASQEAVTAAIGFARSLAARESERIVSADNQLATSIKAQMQEAW